MNGRGTLWRKAWRELVARSSDALIRFTHHGRQGADSLLEEFPRWGLVAGEIEETEHDVVVSFELPGIRKEDCQITLDGNLLTLRGEKHFARNERKSSYHVMERAYGSFERTIALPRDVVADKAQASYRDGVMTIRLPKVATASSRFIPVS